VTSFEWYNAYLSVFRDSILSTATDFKVSPVVNIRITVLWDVTVCSLVESNVLPPLSASGSGGNIFLWHGVTDHKIISFRRSKN
jgi:hypothetical protein